ncbi:HMG domain containing protein, partial [Euroglyphus maynei]
KRTHEDAITTSDVKRIKPNEPSEQAKSAIHHNQSPVVRIIANQQQQQPSPQQPFKSTFSPITDRTTMNQDKMFKSFVSSTPKINTIIASRQILPRSIQEQRRINQANRARLQMQQQQQLKDEFRQKQLDSANNKQQSDTSTNNTNNNNEEIVKTPKKPGISAYVLWCKENRSHIQSNYPELGFCDLSKKMGGIWHTLPKMEKDKWTRKAQLMTKYGTGFNMGAIYEYDDEDLKPEIVLDSLTLPITKTLDKTYGENFINTETSSIEGEKHHIGTELIDAQSYLSILGDSLMTISSYIQRGIKYNSEIDYCPMAAVSTLLDTALVSMSTLASIALSLPNNSVDRKMAKKSIENTTYFMPPSEF